MINTFKVPVLAVCCSSMLLLSACKDKKDDPPTPQPKKTEPVKAVETKLKAPEKEPEKTPEPEKAPEKEKAEDGKAADVPKADGKAPDALKANDKKTGEAPKAGDKAPNTPPNALIVITNKNAANKTSAEYLGEVAYSADTLLEDAASINVMSYNMPTVLGKTAKATAMVMIPKTPQPKDGWRIVVWEHGTVGLGDRCAPSANKINASFKILATSLLKAGYVIVAPDYEGVGTPGVHHPYMNLGSAAKSAIYAVNAIKKQYGKTYQGSWMAVGQSQGGHGALGTAEYSNNDTTYKGTIASAPVSNIVELITARGPARLEIGKTIPEYKDRVLTGYSDLLTYASYFVVGIKASNPSFNYQELFIGSSATIAEAAEGGPVGDNGRCLADMRSLFMTEIKQFTEKNPLAFIPDYPGIIPNFATHPMIVKYIQDNLLGTKKLNTPTLIIQGLADSSVDPLETIALKEKLERLGSIVTYSEQQDATHATAIDKANDTLMEFVKKTMPAS